MMNKHSLEVQELLEQGKVLYSVDKYDAALTYFKKALELDQYCEAVYENMSMCYIMMDEYAEAKRVLNRYLMLNKKSGATYFHLGNIALLEENPAEARAHYSKAELLGFNNPVMFVNLASFYEDMGDIDRALEQYAKILRLNPYDYAVLERKAQMLLRAERFAETLQTAQTMVQTDIDGFAGHHLVYVSLIMLNRYEEAGKYLDELSRRFPENEMIHFDRARLYDLNGETDKALETLESHFHSIENDRRLALLKLGLLLQKKEADRAIELVESSPVLQEEENALTMMYSMYYARGDYAKAIDYCNKIQALGEDSSQYYATWYFKPLAQKRLGKTEQADKDFAEASAKLREVCLKQPAHVELNMYRALCEYQLGHYAEAKKLVEYLLAVKGDEAAFHMAAAVICEALGEADEAQTHRANAHRLDPNAVPPMV